MTTKNFLLPQHKAMLEASAISPDVAADRGYESISQRDAEGRDRLMRLGFSKVQVRLPGLLIPLWGIVGTIVGYQYRPDDPRTTKGGSVKYETPSGQRNILDVPPAVREAVRQGKQAIFVTEGARKADALASLGIPVINVAGVWAWRGKNKDDGYTALSDWEDIAIKGNIFILGFDSDILTKPPVHLALSRLKRFLEGRGADRVRILMLPPSLSGKTGVDDYIAETNATVEDLAKLVQDELPSLNGHDVDSVYAATDGGLVWNKPTANGTVPMTLTNFSAKITTDISEDDGVEHKRLFELEAKLKGRTIPFIIPAPQFNSMNWTTEYLGATALIYPGFNAKDHARTAIQLLSGDVPERTTYTHLGWRKVNGEWVYLHAGGAIGANGVVPDVSVRLPEALSLYELPQPPDGEDLALSINASLKFLELAPLSITVPLYATCFRVVFGGCNYTVYQSGRTGSGKTEKAALIQQHFGAGMDALHLPGAWSGTANSLEATAFLAKDAILVVDDFAPTGSQADVQRQHREADRLLRAQRNRSGRSRMRPDSSVVPAKPPRGGIISNGEDVPRGQSLQAGMFVVEFVPGALDWDKLTDAQADAKSGLYAQAMAGFLQWVAPRYESIMKKLADDMALLRANATSEGQHKRTPEIVANLAIGLRYFLSFAEDSEALTGAQAEELWARCWGALMEAAQAQAQYQDTSEPTSRFLAMLRAAIASGEAYATDADGNTPANAEAWGWRRVKAGSGMYVHDDMQSQGRQIGWVDGDDLYLQPDAAYKAAQRMAGDGEGILLTSNTLRKRLNEKGLLASTDTNTKRATLTIRKTLQGSRRDVLHLHADSLMSIKPDQPDQFDQPDKEIPVSTAPETPDWSSSVVGFSDNEQKSDQKTRPMTADDTQEIDANGRIGQVGQVSEAYDRPKSCPACLGAEFWQRANGGYVCSRCHPKLSSA